MLMNMGPHCPPTPSPWCSRLPHPGDLHVGSKVAGLEGHTPRPPHHFPEQRAWEAMWKGASSLSNPCCWARSRRENRLWGFRVTFCWRTQLGPSQFIRKIVIVFLNSSLPKFNFHDWSPKCINSAILCFTYHLVFSHFFCFLLLVILRWVLSVASRFPRMVTLSKFSAALHLLCWAWSAVCCDPRGTGFNPYAWNWGHSLGDPVPLGTP